jgi:hypothetical protein
MGELNRLETQFVVDCVAAISKVLKEHFPNLTVNEVLSISGRILDAIKSVNHE